jgi:hypothetical protein
MRPDRLRASWIAGYCKMITPQPLYQWMPRVTVSSFLGACILALRFRADSILAGWLAADKVVVESSKRA